MISKPVLKRTSASCNRHPAPTSGTELVVSGLRLSGSVPSTSTAVPPRLGAPCACASAGRPAAASPAASAPIESSWVNFIVLSVSLLMEMSVPRAAVAQQREGPQHFIREDHQAFVRADAGLGQQKIGTGGQCDLGGDARRQIGFVGGAA